MRLSYLTLDEMYAPEIYPRLSVEEALRKLQEAEAHRQGRSFAPTETALEVAFKRAGIRPAMFCVSEIVKEKQCARDANMVHVFKKAGIEPRDQHTYQLVRSLKRRVRKYHIYQRHPVEWHVYTTTRDGFLAAHERSLRNILQDLGGLASVW